MGRPRSATASAVGRRDARPPPGRRSIGLSTSKPALRRALLAASPARSGGSRRRSRTSTSWTCRAAWPGTSSGSRSHRGGVGSATVARGEIRLPWPYTQGELAGMIGGSRQSVNRLLADFVGAGSPAVRGRRAGHPGPTSTGAGGSPLTTSGRGGGRRATRAPPSTLLVARRRPTARRRSPRAAGATSRRSRRSPTRRSVAMRVTAASIALYDAADRSARVPGRRRPAGRRRRRADIAAHEGIAGYVFSTGQPLAIADVAADPRFERATAERTGYVPRSLLAVPLGRRRGDASGSWSSSTGATARRSTSPTWRRAARFAAAATTVARARPGSIATRSSLFARPCRSSRRDPRRRRAPMPRRSAVDDARRGRRRCGSTDDDPLWRLADRIGRLRGGDPDDVELAVDWLDALLAHGRAAHASGR